jgi:hypothetical protein
MTEECFPLDELDSILDLGPDDPRRRHLADCPLCRARLAAYRTFLAEGPPLAGSRPEKAKVDLERFIDTMVRRNVETKVENGFWARLRTRRPRRRALIPGLSVAAAAIVILVIALHPFTGGDRTPALLRGGEPSSGAALVIQPASLHDGAVTFSWSPLPDAESYELLLYDTKLEEIARFEADRATSIRIEASDIPAADGPVLWRIVALREGEEYARSPLGSLDLGKR